MGWANGKLGLFRPGTSSDSANGASSASNESSSSGARRLAASQKSDSDSSDSSEETLPTPYEEMLDTLSTIGLGAFVLVVARVCIIAYWKRRANVKYYRERARERAPEEDHAVRSEGLEVGTKISRTQRLALRKVKKHGEAKPEAFRPLPAAFIFPNLESMAFGLFSLGITESSVAALSSDSCNTSCVWLATLALVVVALFTLTAFALILRFHVYFSEQCWSRFTLEESTAVEDPIMRLVSKIRRLCCTAVPIDRAAGAYESQPDSEEPMRTERLLKYPFSFFHSNAGDAFDAISLFWLMRTTSRSALTTFYDFICFVVMQGLAVAYGLEAVVETYTAGLEQALVVTGLQLVMAVYVFVVRPSIDRLENSQTGIQFVLEGLSTGLLVLPLFMDVSQEDSALLAFLCALGACLFPILTTLYDTFIVPLAAWVAAGGGLGSFGTTLLEIIWSIPAMFANLMGWDSADLQDTLIEETRRGTLRGEVEGVLEGRYSSSVTTAQAAAANTATDMQRLVRGHLGRSQRSFMHTCVHDYSSTDPTVCSRKCIPHRHRQQSPQAAMCATGLVATNGETHIGHSSNTQSCYGHYVGATVVDMRPTAEAPELEEAFVCKIKRRVPTRRKIRISKPRPSFSREVSVMSAFTVEQL